MRATWSGSQRCWSTVASRLLEVDVDQARVIRPAGGDHHVVDQRRQLVEEPLETVEIRRVEGGTAQRVELERRVLEALRIPTG